MMLPSKRVLDWCYGREVALFSPLFSGDESHLPERPPYFVRSNLEFFKFFFISRYAPPLDCLLLCNDKTVLCPSFSEVCESLAPVAKTRL